MLTYQDLLEVPRTDEDLINFTKKVIDQHKASELYRTAVVADEYDRGLNRTIREYQKFLYSMTGQKIPDQFSSNYKMVSGFFNRFITQENQYSLGNGITWKDGKAEGKLGEDFDYRMQELGHMALSGGVSFGFYNMGKVYPFGVMEYAPLYDEEDGGMKAGVRFWQIDEIKPLRATLYELDGYTDIIWGQRDHKAGQILHPKRPYILKARVSVADGEEIYDGENYPAFPIVPLWGNPQHQSEIVRLRQQIDCYDLIKNGYANNVDDGSYVYWTLANASGMSDVDMAEFVQRMKTMHIAKVDDDVTADSHNLEAPYQSREALLATLRADLYEDAKALDTKNIANGAITATQIEASYEQLNSKADQFENCIREFIDKMLLLAGVEDVPTFTRSVIVNRTEEIQNVLSSAQYLPEDYITTKILTILGDGDLAEDIVNQMEADEIGRYSEEAEEYEEIATNEENVAGNGTEVAQNEE